MRRKVRLGISSEPPKPGRGASGVAAQFKGWIGAANGPRSQLESPLTSTASRSLTRPKAGPSASPARCYELPTAARPGRRSEAPPPPTSFKSQQPTQCPPKSPPATARSSPPLTGERPGIPRLPHSLFNLGRLITSFLPTQNSGRDEKGRRTCLGGIGCFGLPQSRWEATPAHAGAARWRYRVEQGLACARGGSRLVQNRGCLAGICDAKNQQRCVRPLLDSAVSVVNVDVGFAEPGGGAR